MHKHSKHCLKVLKLNLTKLVREFPHALSKKHIFVKDSSQNTFTLVSATRVIYKNAMH